MEKQKPSEERTVGLQIRLSQELKTHTASVRAVRFSPASRTLVSSDGQHLFFWEKEGHLFHQEKVLNIPSSRVRFSPGGERLAVVGIAPTTNRHLPSESTVYLCDSAGEKISQVPLAFSAHDLTFDPDNQFLVIGDRQGGVMLWGLEERQILAELLVLSQRPGAPRPISVSISRDGSLLAVGYDGLQGAAQLYTLLRSEQGVSSLTLTLKGTFGAQVSSGSVFAFSSDQRFLATVPRGEIELYDPSSLAFVTRLPLPTIGKPAERDRVECLTFSPDSQYVAAATVQGMVSLWELATFQLVTSFAAHTDVPLDDAVTSLIGDIDWSPDGMWLVTSGTGDKWMQHEPDQPPHMLSDYSVKIWKVKQKKNV